MAIDGCEVRCTFLGRPVKISCHLHELLGLDSQTVEKLEPETLMGMVMDHVKDQKPQNVELWPLVNGDYKRLET